MRSRWTRAAQLLDMNESLLRSGSSLSVLKSLVALQPWDDVATSQDQYGGHAMGGSFVEDQTQGAPGWGDAEPAQASRPPAQVFILSREASHGFLKLESAQPGTCRHTLQ